MEEKEIIPIQNDYKTDIRDSFDDFINSLIKTCHFETVEFKKIPSEIKRHYPHIVAMYDPSDDVILMSKEETTFEEETDYSLYVQLAFAMRYRRLFLQKKISSEIIESMPRSRTVTFEDEREAFIEILGFAKLILSKYSNYIPIVSDEEWEIKEEYKADLKEKVTAKAIEIMGELANL